MEIQDSSYRIPESGKLLLVDSEILGFGIRNTDQISTVDLYQVIMLSELELKVDKIPQVSLNKLRLSQLFLQDKIANLIHKPNKKWYCM